MGFRFVKMGAIVGEDPKAAAEELSGRMRACGSNMGVVAKEYGVHRDTFARWLDQLAEAGHPVEGRGMAKKGRKPGKKGAGEGVEGQQEPVQAAPPPAARGRVRRAPAAPPP